MAGTRHLIYILPIFFSGSDTIEEEAMKRLLLAAVAVLGMVGSVLACSPSPSCWIEEGAKERGSEYLRSICLGYAKDHKTLKQIAAYADEPEKIVAFGKACKKWGVHLRDQDGQVGVCDGQLAIGSKVSIWRGDILACRLSGEAGTKSH